MRYLFLFFWAVWLPVHAQKVTFVDWSQLEDMQRVEKRKVLVDIYADWCNWCKQMDQNFSNPAVMAALDKKYYVVRLNAETHQEFVYKGKMYRFVSQGQRGYNELAVLLMGGGKLSFPCMVFLDEQLVVLQPIRGYHKPEVFASMISYFGSNANRQMSWDKWQDSHQVDTHPEDSKAERSKMRPVQDESRQFQPPVPVDRRQQTGIPGQAKHGAGSQVRPQASKQPLNTARPPGSGQRPNTPAPSRSNRPNVP
jgi:thioredoxin-related protein